MGKSNKKLKSERINAIRKQYDAFLEEDKKRKDRNEYILDKLDKIRTSSAIGQVRDRLKDYFFSANQKQSFYDRKDYMEKIFPLYEKPQYCFNSLNNPNMLASNNEQDVLKEISKKYILIPRHTNILDFNNTRHLNFSSDDNSDWRNKYRILDELKQNEKETNKKPEVDVNDDLAKGSINNEKVLDCTTIKESNFRSQIYDLPDDSSKLIEKSSEKHKDNSGETNSIEQVNFNKSDKNPSIKTEIENQPIDNLENIIKLDKNHESETLARNTEIEKEHANLKSPQSIPTKEENKHIDEEPVRERYTPETDLSANDLTEKEKLQTELEISLKPKEDVLREEVQYSNSNMEDQNMTESLSKFKNYQEDKGEIEVNEEKDKIVLNTDIQQGDNILRDEQTRDEKEPLMVVNTDNVENKGDMQEVNTVQEVNIQNENMENQMEPKEATEIVYVNPSEQQLEDNHESQIEEFEAEQNEMFYSNPNVTEYAYDPTGNVEENYPNDDFIQDENYVYYSGMPQEQVYSEEIDDHEESTEQYDPHYEEQYANYEQQEQVDPTTQMYQAEEIANQQQIYEQIPFEEPNINIVKEVEGQLDAEENYINVMNEDDNVEDIIDEPTNPDGAVVENPAPAPII